MEHKAGLYKWVSSVGIHYAYPVNKEGKICAEIGRDRYLKSKSDVRPLINNGTIVWVLPRDFVE